jgi:murein hydrolase activator
MARVCARIRALATASFVCVVATWSIGAQTKPAQSPAPPASPALSEQAGRRIRELQAEADRLATQTKTVLTELRALELERQIKAQQVSKANAELVSIETAIADTSARLARLETQRVANTPGVNERLVELYKRRRGGYLQLLLQSDDLRAIGRMSRGVASVAQLDYAKFDGHRRTIRAERDAIAELESRKRALAAARDEAAQAQKGLDLALAAHNRRLDQLDRERDLAARYVGELQQAQSDLQGRVASLGGSPSTLPLAPFKGSLDWPLSGRVLSRFGRSAADRFGTAIVRNGIEIATLPAQQVRAVHAGMVAFAAPFTGYGTLVIVDHGGGAFTLYGHLTEASVSEGVHVERGVVVGLAGRNPAGASALYFELRIDGRPVDPVQWLRSTQ